MRTIVRTDALQTLFMIGALLLILIQLMLRMHLDVEGVVDTVRSSGIDRIFVFDDWQTKQNFFKQFFSGIFVGPRSGYHAEKSVDTHVTGG